MSRRDQIELTDSELAAFLGEQRVVICATNGAGGWPHLMPLWYVVRDGEIWAWTYAKSRRCAISSATPGPRSRSRPASSYDQLRGVMIEAATEIHRDPELVAGLGAELPTRYGGGSPTPGGTGGGPRPGGQAGRRSSSSRERTASWDHRKLGGAY